MNINRIVTVGAIIAVVLSVPFFGRNWNRLMHLVGGVLFLGNIIVTAAWASLGRRSRDAEAIRFLVRGILLTDAIFTVPGVILLALNGGILGTVFFKAGAPWIIVSVVLFAITGMVWGALLVPVQKRLAQLVNTMPHGGPIPAEYDALMAKWFRFGGIATLLALIVFALMVFKPAF
jgi:uncharacterized membrane protein